MREGQKRVSRCHNNTISQPLTNIMAHPMIQKPMQQVGGEIDKGAIGGVVIEGGGLMEGGSRAGEIVTCVVRQATG